MAEPIRVTQVLDYFAEPWKLDWYAKNGKAHCNRVSKAAMKIGSRVDEIIKSANLVLKKEAVEVNFAINAYIKWREIYQPKAVVPCTRLYATIEGVEVTGEPDIMVDDVLVDIKCAAKISPKHWVQVWMYRWLMLLTMDKVTPQFPNKVGILRLDKKTGSYEYVVRQCGTGGNSWDKNILNVWTGLMLAMVYLNGEEPDGTDV